MTLLLLVVLVAITEVHSLSTPLYSSKTTLPRSLNKALASIVVPQQAKVFERIQEVSPLARELYGQSSDSNLLQSWKIVQKRTDKNDMSIEQLNNHHLSPGTPLLRLKTTMSGRSVLSRTVALVMDLDQRSAWDDTIAAVSEVHPLDLVEANKLYGSKNVIVSRCGIGHAVTKPAMGGIIGAREQLTVCGVNDFFDEDDGTAIGSIIWGFECADEFHKDLFPIEFERKTRATTHVFSFAMKKLEENVYDVEYILQLDIGGNFPSWAQSGVTFTIVNAVRKMFTYAKEKYFIEGGPADQFIEAQERLEALESLRMSKQI